MLSADTSTMIGFLDGSTGPDVDVVDRQLAHGSLVLSPAVLCELLSDPKLPAYHESVLLRIPVLPVLEGYWERVGHLRRRLLAAHRKAKMADALIAQSCVDHDLMLVTRDTGFEAFARYGGLILWRAARG